MINFLITEKQKAASLYQKTCLKSKIFFLTKIVLTLEATLIQNKEREWTIQCLQRRFLLTPKIRQPD